MWQAFLVGILLSGIVAFLKNRFNKTLSNSETVISQSRFPSSATKPVIDLENFLLIAEHKGFRSTELSVLRQSGNIDRVEMHQSVDSAIKAAKKIFARMRESEVRVWENSADFADVRRYYYSARGSNEGKKIAGISIRILP